VTGWTPWVLLTLGLGLVTAPWVHADPTRGERVFQRCYACHSVDPAEGKLPGPNLHCVLGRHAGVLPGFEFSPAMAEAGRARGLVWTRETLDAFLADPQHLVPGTEMSLPGLPDPTDRRDVIDYLAQVGPCPGGAGGAGHSPRPVARISGRPDSGPTGRESSWPRTPSQPRGLEADPPPHRSPSTQEESTR
jgi:cytochrome c